MKTGQANRCQCKAGCPYHSMPGRPVCHRHAKQPCHISPVTGYEPSYQPDMWNARTEVRETHNCFSYALNVNDPKQIAKCKGLKNCNAPFHQPGAVSGFRRFDNSAPKTCPNMLARIMGDNPTITFTAFNTKCPANTSKIALIVDESDDYHFLRQDSNKFWSHKPGARPVTNVDADGHTIWNPELANFDYTDTGGDLKYDIFCGYMCVPRNKPLYVKIGGGKTRKLRR